MTKIAEELSVSTSTVIRMLNEFQFKTNLNHLPTVLSWDEYSFKKGKMSFIAQDFDNKNIIAILDGRTAFSACSNRSRPFSPRFLIF